MCCVGELGEEIRISVLVNHRGGPSDIKHVH